MVKQYYYKLSDHDGVLCNCCTFCCKMFVTSFSSTVACIIVCLCEHCTDPCNDCTFVARVLIEIPSSRIEVCRLTNLVSVLTV